jgi:hypothetical protein
MWHQYHSAVVYVYALQLNLRPPGSISDGSRLPSQHQATRQIHSKLSVGNGIPHRLIGAPTSHNNTNNGFYLTSNGLASGHGNFPPPVTPLSGKYPTFSINLIHPNW